mgnify:CR=1 FL=1
MNSKQHQTLDFVRNAAGYSDWKFRVSSSDYVHLYKDGKTIVFTISARGDITHVHMDSVWGLKHNRQEAKLILSRMFDDYNAMKSREQRELDDLIEQMQIAMRGATA